MTTAQQLLIYFLVLDILISITMGCVIYCALSLAKIRKKMVIDS